MLHIQDYILFVFLIVAFVIDVRYHKIPNWLTAGGMAVGLLSNLILGGIDGLTFSVIGFLVAGVIFLLIYLFKAVGAGDVKLFAAIGSFVGYKMALDMAMYSIIFGGLIGLIILLFMKTFLRNMVTAFISFINSFKSKSLDSLEDFKVNKGTRFPFMYAVIPAVIISYYYALV